MYRLGWMGQGALGGRRIRFTDAGRRRLARNAQVLGPKVLTDPVLQMALENPNLNPFAERFVRSIKEECLSANGPSLLADT